MEPLKLVRVARVVLIVAAVVLAAVPLALLLDLASGGTGYGLCPGGVIRCRNPYEAAPQVSGTLTFALFVVLAGLRATTLSSRRLKDE